MAFLSSFRAGAETIFPEELRARLHAWRKEVGAQMPKSNPNYDPTKPEFTRKPKKEAARGGEIVPGLKFADTGAWLPPRGAIDD